ncbi:carboxypeptidase-like regulatory domain-containing protein [Alkalilimnicola sp. S0819]|uniref:carboxypeptidase-like regulatory domain-containing protein n=1 Tax=Alkalilimnicola sp. S0819 TaxID=2613922 RepID=UPI00186972AC|nr:carboxypeptidase-like regulatory domain-containing protein [Alkalilimnicola sp. S0819]
MASRWIRCGICRGDRVGGEGARNAPGSQRVPIVETSYYAGLDAITPASSFGDQDVLIQGHAVDRASGGKLPNVPVKVVLDKGGFERSFEVFADAAGDFEYAFTPLSGEAGVYTVSLVHPDVVDRPEHGRFVVSRVLMSPTSAGLNLAYDQPLSIPVKLTAGSGTQASKLRLALQGTTPAGITLDVPEPISINAGQTKTVTLTVTGAETAPETGTFSLNLLSKESGAKVLGTLEVDYRLSQAVPTLQYSPSYVETGVAFGDSVIETVTLSNKGLADLQDVQLSLLDADGSPAPNWVYLITPSAAGNLAVGDTTQVQIAAAPTAGRAAEDIHRLKLRVASANHPTRDVNVYVSVVQDGIGNALFKLSDIYTATLDSNGELIQGVEGARIRVQNENVISVEQTLVSDAAGEALFQDLPAGSYRYRVTADNHEEVVGRLRVKPGITVTEEAFLPYSLVTVQWSVKEITIEDRYEITLHATFETDVPAAVVVAEPASINLPEMAAGDVFQGEIRLTNHGLIRADNLEVAMPSDDQYYRFELMDGLPDSLPAKASIVVPYRLVMLQPFEPDGDASGGGCYTYERCGSANYGYTCANDTTTTGNAGYCFYRSYGTCSGGGGGGSGGWTGGWTGGYGGGYGGGPGYSSLSGTQCVPRPQECEDGCEAPGQGPAQ